MSVIKAKLRQQAAKFISLRETLELMTNIGEGCTTEEAAEFLYRAKLNEKLPGWRVEIFCEITKTDGIHATQLLELVAKNGFDIGAYGGGFYPEDCSEYGFIRIELIEFLSAEGVSISGKSDSIPEWVNSLKGIKRFTLGQAAGVIVGLDPMDDRWPGDDGQRELDKAYTALSQAAEDGDLLSVGKDANDRQLFNAQDLRKWTASVGLDWCIPFDTPAVTVTPAGSADEATRYRLRQLEAENARLAEQVAELRRQLQEATAAPQQAPQEADPAPQQATAAPQDDEGKLLHPKRETTYLNAIGALVELIQSPRPGRDSEAAVIRELLANYGERPGIGKRTLETIFPMARQRLKED